MSSINSSLQQVEFVKSKLREKKQIIFIQIALLILAIGIWEFAAKFKLINPFIFSSPSRIWNSFIEMVMNGKIFYHTGITLMETLVSFIVGGVLGIIIAIALWWNDIIKRIMEPYLVVLNSLPKTALAPIIIVWLGNNVKAIIFTALTISVIITILSVLNGFVQVDEDMIKLITTFYGTKKDILLKVVLPANYPTIVSTMKVNIGLSLIGVIIGEFLVAKAGLGYLIVYGSQVFKLDWVMMSIIILGLLATLLYKLIVIVEKRINANH